MLPCRVHCVQKMALPLQFFQLSLSVFVLIIDTNVFHTVFLSYTVLNAMFFPAYSAITTYRSSLEHFYGHP